MEKLTETESVAASELEFGDDELTECLEVGAGLVSRGVAKDLRLVALILLSDFLSHLLVPGKRCHLRRRSKVSRVSR